MPRKKLQPPPVTPEERTKTPDIRTLPPAKAYKVLVEQASNLGTRAAYKVLLIDSAWVNELLKELGKTEQNYEDDRFHAQRSYLLNFPVGRLVDTLAERAGTEEMSTSEGIRLMTIYERVLKEAAKLAEIREREAGAREEERDYAALSLRPDGAGGKEHEGEEVL